MTVFKLRHKNGGFFGGGWKKSTPVGKTYGRKNDVSNSLPNSAGDYDVVEYELVEVRRTPASQWQKEVADRREAKRNRKRLNEEPSYPYFQHGGQIFTSSSSPEGQKVIGRVINADDNNSAVASVGVTNYPVIDTSAKKWFKDSLDELTTEEFNSLIKDGQGMRKTFDA